MLKSSKKNYLMLVLLISIFLVIPSLLIGIQRDIEIPIEKKNPNEDVNTRSPQESSIYYATTPHWSYGVYVSGDYAYVADADGLAVINITDPTNPGTVVYEDTAGWASDVYICGDYAYVADKNSGLVVINISDPTNPGTPVYANTSGSAHDVYVSGDYAYVADRSSGLAIINITHPTNPGTPIYEATTGVAYGVYVSGDYAYLATGPAGLDVIDISDPTNPETPNNVGTTGTANGVYVSGDYAYVAAGSAGLDVIDISDPTNPGTPDNVDTTGYASEVYVNGDYAYVADRFSGLAVIDISDPTNPGTPLQFDTTQDSWDIHVSGDYAYLAVGFSGLAVIDISAPIDPETPFYEDTTGQAADVYVSGDYAYVADLKEGLAVIDISDPTDPGTPFYENTTGDASDIYVSGDYAYVADGPSGLAVIDISDPTNPGTPVYVVTDDYARGVYVSGNYAYVADFLGGLAIINITDPTNPSKVANKSTNGESQAVYVSGNYAYVADYSAGLAVIDISDPTNPGTAFYESTAGGAIDVYVSGDYAYIADYSQGLAVINISDPTNPGTPVYENTTGDAFGVYVSGDYAYITNYFQGLAVMDVSDPTNPGTPVYEDTTGQAVGVCVSGNYAYVADYPSGLAVIKIRNSLELDDPIISNSPSDFSEEYGYTGQSLSWTANDTNPDTYTIERIGFGIVVASTPWANNTPIVYNIPDGLSVGTHTYNITLTDDFGNFIIDSVDFTVEDTIDPIVNPLTVNHTVEAGYVGALLWWTATDANPDTYTVELLGTGLVEGPTAWTSGNAINYSIPTGLGAGSYIYKVNFTDISGNFATDDINFTVIDTSNPFITVSPFDSNVEEGYSGQSLSWTVLDFTPNTYTIELQGTGIVVTPTLWISNTPIIYNIPGGFTIGSYIYTINITDDSGNFATDTVNFTVEDITNPVITNAANDLAVEFGYSSQFVQWSATDLNPNTYTVELQGTGIVAGPTPWTPGVLITYYIPDNFAVGSYTYTVNFTDDYGNSITDNVIFDVADNTNPHIVSTPGDLTLEAGYSGESLSWTATDAHPDYYEIDLQGSGMQVGGNSWTCGVAITYNIPEYLDPGVYVYTVTFTDEHNNFISDTVTVTVNSGTPAVPAGGVPFGNYFLLFIGLSVICLILAKKRKIVAKNR